MFIQTEQTPNPATLKFLPGQAVLAAGTADFPSADKAGASPIAKGLFAVDGVTGVFLGSDFITVTKSADKEWSTIKPHVLAAIMDHFLSGLPALSDNAPTPVASSDDDSDVVKQIRELIEQRVRPAVAQDGGDITFNRFEEGVVYLNLKGSCAGCPSSTATLKSGIENMLKHYIPEVVEVRQVL
ncbi:MAG: NifU family protein [Alphaproteobacteria bacterium]|nr:NifU family protein [Alphaproteobacteria bacterium]